MYCTKCSERLIADANFCHRCGYNVAGAEFDGAANGVETLAESSHEPAAPEDSEPVAQAAPGNGGPHEMTDVETDVWQGRFNPKAMAISFVVVALLSFKFLVAAIFAVSLHLHWLLVVSFMLLAATWLVQCFRVAKQYLLAQYRLTDRRLFLDRGIFSRHKDQLDLARVEDVRILQNVLHRFLDVGSIEILSTDRRLRRVVLDGINDADTVAETIRTLARQRRVKPPAPAESVKA